MANTKPLHSPYRPPLTVDGNGGVWDADRKLAFGHEETERRINAYEADQELIRELVESVKTFFKGGWEGMPKATYQEYERVIAATKKAAAVVEKK